MVTADYTSYVALAYGLACVILGGGLLLWWRGLKKTERLIAEIEEEQDGPAPTP
ncbi:MAG: hypothetical protein H7831_15670 [Magnetococcus sp. WYHC-3]